MSPTKLKMMQITANIGARSQTALKPQFPTTQTNRAIKQRNSLQLFQTETSNDNLFRSS